MAKHLKSIGTAAAQIATLAVIERLIPALAAGLVTLAHELHSNSAKAEAERRANQCR